MSEFLLVKVQVAQEKVVDITQLEKKLGGGK